MNESTEENKLSSKADTSLFGSFLKGAMVFLVAGPLFLMSIMILISAPEEADKAISLTALSGSPLLVGAIAMLIGRFDLSFENIENALKNEPSPKIPFKDLQTISKLMTCIGVFIFFLGFLFSAITIFTLASNIYG